MMDIRTLDFTKFHGTPEERQQFSNEFLAGLTEAGFVKLVNHGLTKTDFLKLFQQVIEHNAHIFPSSLI